MNVTTDLNDLHCPEKSSNFLNVNIEVFKKKYNKNFQLLGNLKAREADAHYIRPVAAAENYRKVENLSPVLIQTTSEEMVESLQLVHELVDVVDRENRKLCVTLLRYNADKPESSFVQVRVFAGKREEKKSQQIVYVNFKLEGFFSLLDVKNSVYDKITTKENYCSIKCWGNLILFIVSFSIGVRMSWINRDKRNLLVLDE